MKNQVLEIIKHRRSVYPPQFDSEQKIKDDTIKELLEVANYAPTHKRTEPWRFIVFSAEQVDVFYQNMLDIYESTTDDQNSIESKKRKWENKAQNVSHVVAIYMKRDDKMRVPKFEEEWSVACSVQNILLAAPYFGISGYWGTGELAFSTEMKEFLKLSENDQCMGFLQLGVLKEGIQLPDKKPLVGMDEKISWR